VVRLGYNMSMTIAQSIPREPRGAKQAIPPLENGDRLTRAEFERRYAAMPQVKKAELIEGMVHMPSPVRMKQHGKPYVMLSTLLGYYLTKTPGLEDYGGDSTVRLDEDNEPQPDLLVVLPPQFGGKGRVDEEGYVVGPPDLVCEVAASSVSIDMHAKLNAYRRNGVREYLVWRVDDDAVDWFVLREGRYDPMQADEHGLLKSGLLPGLWLDTAALLKHDLPKLLAAVDAGTATAEHGEFVKRLAAGVEGLPTTAVAR
jgi:Uma2 family endonuclease